MLEVYLLRTTMGCGSERHSDSFANTAGQSHSLTIIEFPDEIIQPRCHGFSLSSRPQSDGCGVTIGAETMEAGEAEEERGAEP